MARAGKKGYEVCWQFSGRPRATCRELSATQHRSPAEAAMTVLRQNPRASVTVIPHGGARGKFGAYTLNRRTNRPVRKRRGAISKLLSGARRRRR